MSNPPQQGPPRVGFPQAFGTSYQPMQQFNQFQQNSPSISQSQFPPPMSSITQPPQPNFATAQHSQNVGLGRPQHQFPAPGNNISANSAFTPVQPRPLNGINNVNPSNPPSIMNGIPPATNSAQPLAYPTQGRAMHNSNGIPQNSTPFNQRFSQPAVAQVNTSTYNSSYPQPAGFHGQHQQMPQPNVYNQQQMGTHQMQTAFSNMNITGTAGPMGGWGGRPDLMDLMTERNVVQYGFNDISVQLPANVANCEAKCDPSVMRSTINCVPHTDEILKKSRLPFGLTLHPFRDLKNLNIIQTTSIVRCRYCRTYINPFVYLPDSRHWKCNVCMRSNDLPDDFCWDSSTKSFGDPVNRPEIQNATVEFIAPSEYMLRPPQPAVYVFILDVSAAAVESGYLLTLVEQLLINLDQLPGDDRAQVAFIGVDSCLHFFQFSPNSSKEPRQLIVDDITDVFLPTNSGLLVPLKKNKEAVRKFIGRLPTIFDKPSSNSNCLGAALNVVREMIADIGGRISVFQAALPDIGPGTLQSREDPNQRASSEVQNLGPATDFYKRLALECTGQQISMDLFLFSSTYSDLASICEIAKFSTGCVYYFPRYHCLNELVEVRRFERTISRYLTRKIGFEAVLRIRCSKGLVLSGFYGNFFVRSTDLLALANVNPDSALAVQVQIEEKLPPTVSFQAALLYTSSKGDRRIRVHTMCLPTTSDLSHIYASFDLKASISLLAKLGVERSMSGAPLSDSREAMVNAVIDTLGAFQRTLNQKSNSSLLVSRTGHLRLFPVYALAMLKHTSLCSGRSVPLDERVASMMMLRFCPLEQILSDIYPQLYRLNEIAALPENQWLQSLPLSFEHIHRDGVYLLEAGTALYLYVPSTADPSFLTDVFGGSYNVVDEKSFIERDNPTSKRVHTFIKQVSGLKFYLGPLIVIREDSPLREVFVRRLVEDRSESTHSYIEFLQHIKREMSVG